MELNGVKDAFNHISEKQEQLLSKFQEFIDQVGREIELTLVSIQSGSVDHKAILTDLNSKLQKIGSYNMLVQSNMNLSKYPELLERLLNPNISKPYKNLQFDPHVVNQIILNHFYLEGQFDIANALINESGQPDYTSLHIKFTEMHRILAAIKSRNLEPALNWVISNREKLKEAGADLELKLHGQHFVEILQKRSYTEAMNYARTYLAPFAQLHMNEIQKYTTSLLWAGKLEKLPYPELLAPTQWENLAEEMTQLFCSFLGQSHRSPLSVTVDAGVEVLPTVVKLANVMAENDWLAELSIPVELGKEFLFHSVFVCPVSWEQASKDNPPMLLPCGHVLCKQSINGMLKNSTHAFKCPLCPVVASAAQCRKLHF